MQRRLSVFLLSLLMSCAPPINSAKNKSSVMTRSQVLQMGQEDVQRFYSGSTPKLWQEMSAKMKRLLRSESMLQEMSKQVGAQFGSEIVLLHQDALPSPSGLMIYMRTVEFSKYKSPMVITLAYGMRKGAKAQAVIEGFYIKPEANPALSSYGKYQDRACLQFPLKGEWTIYQGGETVSENYHAATPDQRYAFDVVRLKNDRLFLGKGETNGDWFSFQQPVYADGRGKIVGVTEGLPDNPPMKPNESVPKHGNSVVIDHGNGEFSMYAHLSQGSITVKVGQIVAAGDQLGRVGNSGNSPFPHLHFHLQDTGVWFDGFGLPLQFHRLTVNGKPMQLAMPIRGDDVENVGYGPC
jgi:murein DD-endopeptidase MepM/ murein hydrolase activator NlpD